MMTQGCVWKYGDDVNTDVIFPGKYTYTVTDKSEMAKYALEDLDADFAKNVKKDDIIVAGKNFGCGSSREQAAFCLKYAGVSCIIAKSFARIYFRNCINAGLPVIEADIVDKVKKGDSINVDFEAGIININQKKINFPALPPEVLKILNAGGLENYLRKKLSI